ncbi:hypothetical protein PA7_24870 [Pseudonocardia asaccharolytica DSM 44247 = NBRC 16224]|uniref:Uncharacterized protein n=1 Tax=Pseudonocardia asaccharolytica DSM 44247 = NBRC 16224 TaxID=1123024 RepID=A0A511D1I5_9PSEU|nr:hypothetical protein PA7_24870 [Pseudonocardia asaccharolytica DSM 44247 = NBRC 16224]
MRRDSEWDPTGVGMATVTLLTSGVDPAGTPCVVPELSRHVVVTAAGPWRVLPYQLYGGCAEFPRPVGCRFPRRPYRNEP